MYHLKGFPPLASESIQMLARFSESYVVLSTLKEGTFEYLMAAPDEVLSSACESSLKSLISMTSPAVSSDNGWAVYPKEQLCGDFLEGRYTVVDAGLLVGSSFLWLFRTRKLPWGAHCLLLMDQTRKALERHYGQFFVEDGFKNSESGGDRFKLLMEFSPVGIFFYETSLEMTAFNSRFSEILQTGENNLHNLNFSTLKDQRIMPALKRPLKGKEGYYEGLYQSTISGIAINVLLKTAPVFNERQQVVGVIGVVEDNTDRERTRSALLESEERLRLLINSTPDVICFKDGEERLMVANESWQRLFGLQGKSFLGKDLEDLQRISPKYKNGLEIAERTDQKAWEGKKPIKEEEIFTLSDGSVIVLDVVKAPLFFPDGSKRGLVVLGRDITKRKRMEELLRENEERFRLLAMHSSDVIFEWDPSSNLMQWHGDFSLLSRNKENPATLKDFLEVIHPNDRIKVVRAWEKDFQEGSHWREEFRLLLKDGEVCYLKGSGIVLYGKGKTAKYYGTLTNITREKMLIHNLKEAIQMAEQNKEQVKGLLKAIPDMIFIIDKEGCFRDYHAKSSVRLYVPASQFLNKNVDEVLPQSIANLTRNKMLTVLAQKGIETYTYSLEMKDGQVLDYESRMVYIDQNQVLTIVRDVTRARAVENELIQAKERAEESDRLKSAFLANMSHEIRTPMNGILGFSELIRATQLSEEDRRNYTDVIIRSGNQLLRIIDDVLEVSRLETGQVEVVNVRVNLNTMMADLLRFFGVEADKNAIMLEKQIPDREVVCTLDRGKLTQVMNNLISNALKFTPAGGTIHFGFEVQKKEVRFFVQDTGVGIDPAHHDKIFDRFMQVGKTDSGEMGGTGLGLAICKSLVELMGGKLWVQSKLDEGAQFFFTVPV